MKKFYVGIKGIIKEERGYLILRSSQGYWDIPGGRIDDDEDFIDTISREIAEELPGTVVTSIVELRGAYRLHKDIDVQGTSLVLIYFLIEVKLPPVITLSNEHESFKWINTLQDIPDDINPEMDRILRGLMS